MNSVTPSPRSRYRMLPDACASAEDQRSAHASLVAARERLSTCMRLLNRAGDASPRTMRRYADCTRTLLSHAVVALAEAAVHVVGLRTFTVDVVHAARKNPTREVERLHHLVTQLWWHNSPRFPPANAAREAGEDELAELMWAYSIETPERRMENLAKATAGVTLVALGATISAPAALVCAAVIGAGTIVRS